jgi:hypothetical protein
MLDKVNSVHSNIKLVRQYGTSVSFLDIFIENKSGILEKSVYHKQAAEPYIVPFKSGHPRHVFNNIIDVALTRAMRYSPTLSAFNAERRSIKLILLYNGLVLLCSLFSDSYPPRYINNRFMKFLTNNLRISSIIPLLEAENDFIFIHSHLLYTPTPIEQQIATRITKTIDSLDHDTTNNPLVRLRLETKSKWIDNLIIHYVHEERLTSYNAIQTLVRRRPHQKP